MPEIGLRSPIENTIINELRLGVPILNEPNNLTFGELQPYFIAWKEQRKADSPQEERENIENAYNVLFNVFLLPPSKEIKGNYELKILGARILKATAHSLFKATRRETSEEFSRAMYFVVSNSEILANAIADFEGSLDELLSWRGVARELGMMKTLSDAGYPVYIPNPYNYDENSNELEADVKNGVDMFTVFNNGVKKSAVLINVKGSTQIDYAGFNNMEVNHVRIPKVFVPTLKELGVNSKDVKRITVVLPTMEFRENGFRYLNNDELMDPKSELRKYATLSRSTQDEIVAKLKWVAFYESDRKKR